MYYQLKVNIYATCKHCDMELDCKMMSKKSDGFINNHLEVDPCETCMEKRFEAILQRVVKEGKKKK